MKSKKRFIALAVCAFQLMCGFSVSADTAKLKADVTDDSIEISGTLSTSRAKSDLILRMVDSTDNEIFADFTSSWFRGDEVVFEFDKILLPKTLTSGDYTFLITGEDVELPIRVPYTYVGSDKLLEILTDLSNADKVGNVISKNASALGLDMTAYNTFGDEESDEKKLFEAIMAKNNYDLPSGSESDADRAKIKAEIQKLISSFDEAICLSLFEAIDSSGDATEWLKLYYEELEFDEDDPATSYSESDITDYLETVKSGKTFAKKLSEAKGLDSKEKVREYIYESALLSVIADKRSSVAEEMMLSFPELFEIDLRTLDNLTSTKRDKCFVNISGKNFASYDDASDALNEEISKASGNKRTYGGSSGGGGGGSISVSPTLTPETPVTGTASSNSFADMPSEHWAYSAVMLLAERSIVSGRGDGTFSPDDNVTRAEFIKMIVTAMGVKAENIGAPFTDIAADAWYAPYVAAAHKEGIVLGDTDGKFNPDANISRQDMVTILYRAMKLDGANGKMSFTDEREISDYAKNAVAYFGEKGIVNGIGDGSFAPRANATRAQAAKILYNIITS